MSSVNDYGDLSPGSSEALVIALANAYSWELLWVNSLSVLHSDLMRDRVQEDVV